MKLHQLRTLIAVHESGSLQEASKQLHVTQPALSRAIRELEQELGVPLLVRSSRGATLTHYGQRLLGHARQVSESLRRARQDIDDLKGEASHEVTLAVTSAVSLLSPIADALCEFQQAFPKVKLHLYEQRPVQILNLLREGQLDFALISQMPSQPNALNWVPVCRLPMQIVVNRDHPLGAARSLRELQNQRWQTSDAPTNPNSTFFQLFNQNGLPLPECVMECTSVRLALDMMFYSPVFSLVAKKSFEAKNLHFNEYMRPVNVIEPVPDSYVSMICIDHGLLTRPAALLFDLIHTHLLRSYPRFS